ncbi:MAG: hypothetical protein LQ339_006123 [Xanthoria mediterranea]|nr:MAG: hypothetical protein LQ339_006123 [Xanthoria mediterranea]
MIWNVANSGTCDPVLKRHIYINYFDIFSSVHPSSTSTSFDILAFDRAFTIEDLYSPNMPVTVKPTNLPANPVRVEPNNRAYSPLELLNQVSFPGRKGPEALLQTSFDPRILQSIGLCSNGFVKGAIRAYSSHHHLRIRPEDVWFAILSQLSLYINAHAEEVRDRFVSHEGKKELELIYDGTRSTVDFRGIAKDMGNFIEKKIVDAELREWMMPAFTTTTKNDTVVASILLMGLTQKYFDFKITLRCGLPSVTLLGENSDWELILKRIEKLNEYGEEPREFCNLLRPVISRFVRSFDDPTSPEILTFWNRIAHYLPGMSGPSFYSGWISAFCFWGAEGETLWKPRGSFGDGQDDRLSLDGVVYHLIESDGIPACVTSVPVKVDDNGHVFMATMVAGSIGTRCIGDNSDSLQPESGWWMCQDELGQSEK